MKVFILLFFVILYLLIDNMCDKNIEQFSPISELDDNYSQVDKLVDVLRCIDHTSDGSVVKEMGLIKIEVSSDARSEALQIAEHYGCKTIDLTDNSMIIQVVGNPDKIDSLEKMISKFKIVELVRTGKVVMSRGNERT